MNKSNKKRKFDKINQRKDGPQHVKRPKKSKNEPENVEITYFTPSSPFLPKDEQNFLQKINHFFVLFFFHKPNI